MIYIALIGFGSLFFGILNTFIGITAQTKYPWVHIFSPSNKAWNGRDPVDMLWAMSENPEKDINAKSFEPYIGPLPNSEEYKAAQMNVKD